MFMGIEPNRYQRAPQRGGALEPSQLRTAVSAAVDATCKVLPPSLLSASDSLRVRACRRPDRPVRTWCDVFSDLTLLYPALQVPACLQRADTVATDMLTAHVHALIWTFGEDRFLDGQVRASRQHYLFLSACRHTAFSRLARIALAGGAALETIDERLRAYLAACAQPTPAEVDELEQLAADRAACGLFATLVLAELHNLPLTAVLDAFAALTIALQWLDDIEDWSDDYVAQRPNLFVAQLRWCDPRRTPDGVLHGEQAPPAVEETVYAALDAAESRVNDLLATAAHLQRVLGADQLAAMIEELRTSAAAAFGRHREFWSHAERAHAQA